MNKSNLNSSFTEEELELIKQEKNLYQREYNKKNSDKRKIWNANYYLKKAKARQNDNSN